MSIIAQLFYAIGSIMNILSLQSTQNIIREKEGENQSLGKMRARWKKYNVWDF